MFVYENGLMLGTSKTLFSPHGTVMRGMMATILWRMEGSPVPKGKNSFTDVEAGKWYADAITWTAENGIFAGYGKDKFGPDDPITREQLAAIFYRYADYKGYDLTVKEIWTSSRTRTRSRITQRRRCNGRSAAAL